MFDQCDDPPNLLCQQNKHRALKTVLNKTKLDKRNVLHLTEIQRYITLQKSWVWSKLDLSKKAKPGKGFFKTKTHQRLKNLKAKKYHQPKNVCIEFYLWTHEMSEENGILLPKLSRNVRKICSSDWEKLLKCEDEGQEFAKFLRSLEQFNQTVKDQNNFW